MPDPANPPKLPPLTEEDRQRFIRLGQAFGEGGEKALREEFDRLFPPESEEKPSDRAG